MINMRWRVSKTLAISLFFMFVNAWGSPVTASDAYVRLLPPTQKNTGAFMILNNTGTTDISVINAQSEVAKKVELHTHIHDGDVMRMRQVEKIDIPAGDKIEFKPGGYHIMLLGLKKPLVLGQLVNIKLQFNNGTTELISAPVKSVLAGMKMKGTSEQN